jgi:hypothetical protein
MPGSPQPVDLLEFVGERGRQYVLPAPDADPTPRPTPGVTDVVVPAPTVDRPRRQRRAEAKAASRAATRAAARAEHLARAGIVVDGGPAAAADLHDLAGDPDTRYVTPVAAASSPGRQRAWLICVLLLAVGLPAMVVTYGYNRGDEAVALAAPPTTAATVLDTTSESRLATTETTAEEPTTTAAVEETTTAPTEAPTTSSSLATTSTTAYATSSTTAYAYTAAQPQVQAAPVTAAPTTAAPTTTAYVAPPPTTAVPAQGEAAFLACVRMRESGGNYGAVSGDGLYRGAYQFHQGTWDNVASMAGRRDLIGVPPNLAGPADQDLLAVTLYRAAGARPWGGYCT